MGPLGWRSHFNDQLQLEGQPTKLELLVSSTAGKFILAFSAIAAGVAILVYTGFQSSSAKESSSVQSGGRS